MVVNLQEELSGENIRRDTINGVYREAAENDPNGYLLYTEEQYVSGDVIGVPKAAAIIEAHETHTRTAEVAIDLRKVGQIPGILQGSDNETVIKIAITQAVIYGWYDNEMGSYVNMLGDRTVTIAESL